MKIQISIETKLKGCSGKTIINRDNFDKAIIDLINEREYYNQFERKEIIKKIKIITDRKKRGNFISGKSSGATKRVIGR